MNLESDIPYIDDAHALREYVTSLYNMGYIPSFAVTLETSQGRYRHKSRLGRHGTFILTRDPQPLSVYQKIASDRPHRGIGVQCPTVVDGSRLLCALDVDIPDDPVILKCIASIINAPCPTRFGSKGACLFVTFAHTFDRTRIEAYGIRGKFLSAGARPIECMGLVEMQHVLLPPSRHYKDGPILEGPNSKGSYHWIEFPSVNPSKRLTLSLFETPLTLLPELGEHQIMEISFHANILPEAKNAVRDLIIGDPWSGPGDGDYRQRIGAAIHRYAAEGFPAEYIKTRIIQIVEDHLGKFHHPEWGDNNNQLIDDVDGWLRGSKKIRPKAKPAGGNKEKEARQSDDEDPPQAKRAAGKKLPDDREAADWLNEQFPFDHVRIFDGVRYFWDEANVAWRPLSGQVLRNLVYSTFSHLGGGAIKSAAAMWMDMNHVEIPNGNSHAVLFQNGMFDLRSGGLRPPQMNDYNPHPLQVEYAPGSTCPLWLRHIHGMLQPGIEVVEGLSEIEIAQEHERAIDTFEEFLGYSLIRSYKYQKALFVVTPPGAGKGTIWKLMRDLFPDGSVSGESMDELDLPEARQRMVGKLVNFGSESGRRDRHVDAVFNTITAHEPVSVWDFGVSRTTARLMTRLVFDGNHLPSSSDTTGAFKRRAIVLMGSALSPNMKRINTETYLNMLRSELPGIALRLVRAYARLVERGDFDPPKYTEKQTEDLRIEASPVTMWIRDATHPSTVAMPVGVLYSAFREWCIDNGHRFVPPSNVFGKLLTQQGYPSKNVRMGNAVVLGKFMQLIDFNAAARIEAKESYK